MGRQIAFFSVIVVVLGAIFWVLADNKKELEAKKAIKPVTMERVPVKTFAVSEKSLSEHLTLLGTIVPHNDVMVMSETQGRVIQVFKEKGNTVSAGDPIVVVDKELKEIALSTINTNLDKARKDLARLEELLKQKVGTETQVEQARVGVKNLEDQQKMAIRQLNDSYVRAPIGGILYERMANLGTMLGPGTPVGQVVDMSILKLTVSVPEADVFKLKLGDRVEITTDVHPGAKLEGRVQNISPKGDAGHSFPVEIRVTNNPRYPLKAGIFCRANFLNIPSRASVIVPRQALVNGTKDGKVYVITDGIATLRKIELGKEEGEEIEVVSGLNKGEEVVIDGLINLRDQAKVEIIK